MMIEYPIDLLIKQTLRSVVFDSTNMGIMSSRAQQLQPKANSNLTQTFAKDSAFRSLMTSPETIKWLFERPNDYMYKIFENEAFKDTIEATKDETELKAVKCRILYSFLKKLRDSRPAQAMEWVAFQHYMYFVYRNFLTPNPTSSNGSLSSIVLKKLNEIVAALTFEDKTQFYVRIITLLREYVMTARDNYEEISVTADSTVYLKCLLSYYGAFCSAANKLPTVLSDFDQFIHDRFNINWYCLHQRMFFQYFFMMPSVQSKVNAFNKMLEENETCHKDILESYNCFIDDMSVLNRHWELQRQRISALSERNSKFESQWLQKDWRMFEEITKIMKTNFWIIRDDDWKSTEEAEELDGHFLAIVEDTWHIADRLIAPDGNCICEDCMAAEFRQGVITGSIAQPIGSGKLIMCYICRDVICIDTLGNHIVCKHDDSAPRTDTAKGYKYESDDELTEPPNSGTDDVAGNDSIRKRNSGQSNPSIKKGLPVKKPSTKLCKVLSKTINKDAQLFKVNDGNFKIKNDGVVAKEEPCKKLPESPVPISSESAVSFNETRKKCPVSPKLKAPSESTLSAQCNSPSDSVKINIQTQTEKEPVMKIASEPPVFASNNFSDEMEGCRAAFEEFVKSRTAGTDPTKKADELKKDSKKAFSEKKDKTDGQLIDVILPIDSCLLPRPLRRNQSKTSSESKLFDFLRNGNSPKPSATPPTSSNKSTDTGCAGHVCVHKCKTEEDAPAPANGRKACQESCDHHKEPKKCDCAYCEVFGSNVAAHSHKVNETRDRLRTRLNQRKEKINENLKGSGKNAASVKTPEVLNVGACENPAVAPKVPTVKISSNETSPTETSTCSHSKTTSCEKCLPINIKVLSNTTAPKHSAQILCVEHKPKSQAKKSDEDRPDLSDIDGLIDFIQGNKPIDKIAIAKKKAAKKARQRLKKEQAKLRREEEEEARKVEEKRLRDEKRREELRLQAQALARQQAAEQLKRKEQMKLERQQQQQAKQDLLKSSKKKGKNKSHHQPKGEESDLMEETIPAMVTIKRIVENNNSPPTVTITLKGSTPDQDKLLYTLVNGHTSDYVATNSSENNKTNKKKNTKQECKTKGSEANEKDPKKKKKKTSESGGGSVTTKEFKVTLSVDKSFHKGKEAAENVKKGLINKEKQSWKPIVAKSKCSNRVNEQQKVDLKEIKISQLKPIGREFDLDIPSLKLPPGITITKVSGPLTNKNCKTATSASTAAPTQYQNVPVSKSGVIVVDTEKLIQQSITANANKKNKKKKPKGKASPDQCSGNGPASQVNGKSNGESKPAMVTLKNPIFHTLQTKFVEKSDIPVIPYNEQASITKGENGMVTIRRPRCLQLPVEKESPMTEFLSELKPVIGPEVSSSFSTNRSLKDAEHKQKYSATNGFLNNGVCDSPYVHNYTQNGDYKDVTTTVSDSSRSGLSAHDILWGLPGIEITKVNKNAPSNEAENKKSCQTADVSIIPTGNGLHNGEKFNFDRDDWPFESVFAPKDIPEDDLDADERELEAFKRFCQQSVPPKHKEKVAHLNVKDIVLKKKNDVTYS